MTAPDFKFSDGLTERARELLSRQAERPVTAAEASDALRVISDYYAATAASLWRFVAGPDDFLEMTYRACDRLRASYDGVSLEWFVLAERESREMARVGVAIARVYQDPSGLRERSSKGGRS